MTRPTIVAEGLRHHGKRPIQNVHDVNLHYLFWIHLGFWGESADDPLHAAAKSYYGLPTPIEAIDIAASYWFDAIIGMDVISQFDLRIERTGDFELRLN